MSTDSRKQTAERQKRWRAKRPKRIDYCPSGEAVAVIEAYRVCKYPRCSYSSALNAMVRDWANLTGIKEAASAAAVRSDVHPLLRAVARLHTSEGSKAGPEKQSVEADPAASGEPATSWPTNPRSG